MGGTPLAPGPRTEVSYVNSTSTPAANPAAAGGPSAQRDSRLTALLIVIALLAGAVLQIWVPPGRWTAIVGAGLASWVVVALAVFVPGRLRQTVAGFRFTSTLLIGLAVFAILGTLILQGKPEALYRARYGAVAPVIIGLRLDDIFHGLPFAGLMALFGAAVMMSASLRWPLRGRNLGFFVAHVGLLTSLGGAAASSGLGIRGRIDLHAGGDVARELVVTKGGIATGEIAPLGFDLKLDKFDLVLYESEYRVGYYEKARVRDEDGNVVEQWRLKTSFDPDTTKHRLPGGDSFRLEAVYPDFQLVPQVSPVAQGGSPALQAVVDGKARWLMDGESVQTGDGRLAVAFGWGSPAAPEGVLTAVLVSGAARQVTIHTSDGDATQPLREGAPLLGGAVKIASLLPSAQRSSSYGTASAEWRNPAASLETMEGGYPRRELVLASRPRAVMLARGGALVFEKRDQEAKAFLSHVTATRGDDVVNATVAVNDPLSFHGWTLYQVNYNPKDPTYSGIEAVYDPGVPFVFLGFALICLGVFHMFYIAPRFAAGVKRDQPAGPAAAA